MGFRFRRQVLDDDPRCTRWTGPACFATVTDVLAEHRLSIISARAETGDDFIARMDFEFELADLSQLDSVLSRVLALEAVFEAYRVLPGRNTRSN